MESGVTTLIFSHVQKKIKLIFAEEHFAQRHLHGTGKIHITINHMHKMSTTITNQINLSFDAKNKLYR